jgi:protein tyrosine phosphatase
MSQLTPEQVLQQRLKLQSALLNQPSLGIFNSRDELTVKKSLAVAQIKSRGRAARRQQKLADENQKEQAKETEKETEKEIEQEAEEAEKASETIVDGARSSLSASSLWELTFRADCETFENWLQSERMLEKLWEQLEERTFVEIVGFGKTTTYVKYDMSGPKAVPCRHGLTTSTPWTLNRVKLSASVAGTERQDCADDPDPTFINASMMQHDFIAAAVPQNDAARAAFWRLIYEQGVCAVVMLNRALEQSNVPYWAADVAEHGRSYTDKIGETKRYGGMLVTCVESKKVRRVIVHRRFRVQMVGDDDDKARVVEQFHYLGWPDMAVPEEPGLFLEQFLMPVLKRRRELNGPVLTHCHGGLGRTGCFIATCVMLLEREALKRGQLDQVPSVQDKVFELRQLRCDQVQAMQQFKFIHRLVYGYALPERNLSKDRVEHMLASLQRDQSSVNLVKVGSSSSSTAAASSSSSQSIRLPPSLDEISSLSRDELASFSKEQLVDYLFQSIRNS